MGDVRAAFAVARKDIRSFSRYRIAVAGTVFTPLYQYVIPAILFWGIAFSLRSEMDMGTLEPSWLTPTRHETFIIGRALGGMFWFVLSQAVLFAFGIWFLGL